MDVLFLLIVYCAVIMALSLAGGRLSSLLKMTHLRTQLLMSGVGGLMLGIALLHLMPHATEVLASPSRAGMGGLIGLAAMFLLVRLFHTHDHGLPVSEDGVPGDANDEPDPSGSADSDLSADDHPDMADQNRSDHQHHGCHHEHGDPAKGVSWFGLFFGLLLHTLVDGIALAASVIAEQDHGAWMGIGGFGTFLAVALHKPLDAFAITSVMSRQRWSSSAQWIANGAFSLACPVGAFAFYLGVYQWLDSPMMLGWGLAVSAGFFIGIALADLLPEVAFHDHDRGKLTATFLLGIAISIGIENLPGHSHDHSDESHQELGAQIDEHAGESHDHSHGHDHAHE